MSFICAVGQYAEDDTKEKCKESDFISVLNLVPAMMLTAHEDPNGLDYEEKGKECSYADESDPRRIA